MKNRFTLLFISICAGCFLFQTASQAQIEEIVVTAQKREQNLQDTPIAITVFSSESLAARMITDISKLADFTPNVIFDATAPISGVSSGAVVFIRGIGQLDFSLTTDPGVGTYIDGVYSSRSIGGVLDVSEIERIEILRGSQGTLFGRNTIGGAISITTRRPAPEFGGSVEATIGEFDRIDFKGAVDLPLAEKFLTKFAFSSKNRDGFVKRTTVGDKLGDEERHSARASFLFTPNADIDLYATLDYAKINEQSAGSVLVGITENPGVPALGLAPSSTFAYNRIFVPQNPGAVPYDERFLLGGDNDRTFATGPTGTKLDSFGATLTFSWSLPWFEFKSISSYRETDGEFYRDPDGAPFAITETSNTNYRHEQFSQEIQLTGSLFAERLQYAAGAYFFAEEGNDDVLVPIFAPLPGGQAAAPVWINNFVGVDNSSRAFFAQGTFDLSEKLALTLGLRHTRDKKVFGYNQYISADPKGAIALVPLLPGGGPGVALTEVEDQFTELNIRAGVEYQFNDDTLFYFSYADGFKSGGFNTRYVVPRTEPLAFDPETLESFEAGVKWQGWDDRLRINAAGFVSKYSDVQIQLFETGGGPLTQNAGVADISGVELELALVPVENLLLNAGLGYINAKYDELNLPTTIVAQGITLDTKLPNTPEMTLNISAEYVWPVSWGALALRGDYRYTDDLFNDAQNSPFLFQEAYHTLNASLTWTSNDAAWDLVVFATNLTDARFIISGDSNFGLGFHEANYNRPREFGATVRYRF